MVNVLLINSLTASQNSEPGPTTTLYIRRKGSSQRDLNGIQGHTQQVNGRAEDRTLTS